MYSLDIVNVIDYNNGVQYPQRRGGVGPVGWNTFFLKIASVVWTLCNFIFIERVRSEPLHPHGEEAWGPWVGIDQIASVVWKLCNFIFIEKVRSEPLHPQWRGGVGPLGRNRSFSN